MIDLIILFFLCRSIGRKAREKGLKPLSWQLFTILAWILCEGIGMNLALGWLGYGEVKTMNALLQIFYKNPGIFAFGLFSAFGGALLVRYVLEKRPPADPSSL